MIRRLCGVILASLLLSGPGSVVAQQPLVPVLIRFQKAPQQAEAEEVKLRGGVTTWAAGTPPSAGLPWHLRTSRGWPF